MGSNAFLLDSTSYNPLIKSISNYKVYGDSFGKCYRGIYGWGNSGRSWSTRFYVEIDPAKIDKFFVLAVFAVDTPSSQTVSTNPKILEHLGEIKNESTGETLGLNGAGNPPDYYELCHRVLQNEIVKAIQNNPITEDDMPASGEDYHLPSFSAYNMKIYKWLEKNSPYFFQIVSVALVDKTYLSDHTVRCYLYTGNNDHYSRGSYAKFVSTYYNASNYFSHYQYYTNYVYRVRDYANPLGGPGTSKAQLVSVVDCQPGDATPESEFNKDAEGDWTS